MFALPPPTSNPHEVSTQTELPSCVELVNIAAQTDPTSPREQATVCTQIKEDINTSIHNYEEDIVLHKVVADKAKERHEEARQEVEKIKE